MIRKHAKEYSKLLYAFSQEKEVQYHTTDNEWISFDPLTIYRIFEYDLVYLRIKPKITAYTWREMCSLQPLHKRLIHKTTKMVVKVISINASGIYVRRCKLILNEYNEFDITYESLLKNYLWEDGSVCGIESE